MRCARTAVAWAAVAALLCATTATTEAALPEAARREWEGLGHYYLYTFANHSIGDDGHGGDGRDGGDGDTPPPPGPAHFFPHDYAYAARKLVFWENVHDCARDHCADALADCLADEA